MSPVRSPFRARPDHKSVAEQARAERGSWFLACVYPTLAAGKDAAKRIPLCQSLTAYEPAGSFEAYPARHEDGTAVWVRYVAGDEPVPVLPDTMTVRVCNRGDGPGYSGVQIATVTVSTRCPLCGGPRGFDTVRNHNFAEDGEYLSVDRWRNPCGHADMYEAVLREARQNPLPRGAVEPPAGAVPDSFACAVGEYAAAIRLLLGENARRHGHLHAKQGAAFLSEHGHEEAAALVRKELDARGGHLSAKQAATYLRDMGEPVTDGGEDQ